MERLVTTTYLEMTSRDELRPVRSSDLPFELIRVEIPCPELNRFLYTAVGARWWWYSRLSRLPNAVQLVYSQAELTYFEKASTFFAAVVEGLRSGLPEPGHELLWVDADEAAALVSHESHRWALCWRASA
jgi:hypothetical protein